MRPVLGTILSIAAAIAVMVLAFWAYRENYATQEALREQRAVQREVAALREAIALQRAEWAYLGRPDRLSALAVANFDRLGLLPMTGEAFGSIAEIPPAPPAAIDPAAPSTAAPDPATPGTSP
jgi:hypothetical protein